MATKSFTTNLKLITSVMETPPTTAQLPLGYMAFGIVNSKASIWANYDNTVRDIIQEGSPKVTVIDTLGSSVDYAASQRLVTDNLALKEDKSNKNEANGYAGLDINAKVLPSVLPDFIMSKLLWGGTVNKTGLATLSAAFKSKYSVATATLQLTAGLATSYEGAFFIAQDTETFTNETVLGVSNVSTGDWLMSNGTAWVKVDNTDAVVSVNGKTGAVTITLAELEGLAADGDASNVTNAFIAAGSRANLASGETLSTSLGKLMKWYTDLSTGLAFATSVTSGQTPIATSTARGAVILPTSSALSVDGSGNVDVKLGDGLKKNASNQLEADIIVTYGVI